MQFGILFERYTTNIEPQNKIDSTKHEVTMKKIVYGVIIAIVSFSILGFCQSMVQISAAKDNTLYEDPNGSLSNGAGDYFFAGKTGEGFIRRALVQFDISTIPAGAVIDSVKLTLHMSKTPPGNQSFEFGLHRVLSDWGEETSDAPGEEGVGTSATTGDATWIHTFYDTQFWTNTGGDFESMASASQSVGDITFYSWGSTDQMVSDVQDWLNNPSNNFGWIILGNEAANTTAKRFDSRENPNVNNQPLLTVYYTPPTSVSNHDPRLIRGWQLFQNYPNPFNPSTTIGFQIPSAQVVTLKIYNILGREVASLVEGKMSAGYHEVTFNSADLSTGIYFYELRSADFEQMKRMVLIK